ncbi:MAG: hypothetical protein U1E62_01150 [Alsobacter sp.]
MSHSHGQHGSHAAHGALRSRRDDEGWSLLRSSLAQRLAGVSVVLAAMWAVVTWALRT